MDLPGIVIFVFQQRVYFSLVEGVENGVVGVGYIFRQGNEKAFLLFSLKIHQDALPEVVFLFEGDGHEGIIRHMYIP